ncbi:MAG: dihydropteroate synthase [candidate division NC10 bacterium]
MLKRAILAGIEVGDGLPVALVGVLNVSPESFYGGSVFRERDRLLAAAQRMVEAGAVLLDVGGMSSAPYLATRIPETEEADRLARAIEGLAPKLGVPISADTWRAGPARQALDAGAAVINDVSGLLGDPGMAPLVARRGAGLIVMASDRGSSPDGGRPGERVLALLGESLALARAAGIEEERIVVDPGIGFFRSASMPWYEWDCRVLSDLGALGTLGRPICVGVSRKSFIGALLGQDNPADRLPGSLAATAVAVVNGAHLIRTHDVAETRQAVRVAEAIRGGA